VQTWAVADGLDASLPRDFASIPQVRDVLTERADGSLLVWISVDDPTPSTRRSVFEKELEIIACLPGVEFEFNLIPSLGSGAREISTTAESIYSRDCPDV
jgi:hypothetical protein